MRIFDFELMIYSTVTHFAKGNHCQFHEPITAVIARMMDAEGWETECVYVGTFARV